MIGFEAAVAALAAMMLTLMLVLAQINRRSVPRLAAVAPLTERRISVLIPARNEAHNLPAALAALLDDEIGHAVCALDVIVLDDQSTDGSAAVLRAARTRYGDRLRVLRGEAPPAGWTGKAWACQQLAAAARGEVLVFCDADVRASADAVRRTAALAAAGDRVVTGLVAQAYTGALDRAVVPLVMHVAPWTTLPLMFAGRRRWMPTFANGQWLAMHRDAYSRLGRHAAAAGAVIEDVALARVAKRVGLAVVPVVTGDAVRVYMYAGARSVVDGFAKNLYPLLGGNAVAFALSLAAVNLTHAAPWLALAGRPAWLPALVLLLLLRWTTARHVDRSALPAWSALAWAPLAWTAIALRSLIDWRLGRVHWKGRRIEVAAPTPAPATPVMAPDHP